MIILYLFFIWLLYWGLYNFVFLKKGISNEKSPTKMLLVDFIFLLPLIILIDNRISHYFTYLIIFALLILFSLVTKSYRSGRIGNSIFQMVWLYALFITTKNSPFLLIFYFTLAHAPIFFVEQLDHDMKIFIIIVSFLGAIIFALSFLYPYYPINLIVAILIHYYFYVKIRPISYKLGLNIVS